MTLSSVILGMPGPWELVLIIAVILLVFGGRKIPELMKGLGQGMREFKKATRDDSDEKEESEKK